MIDYIEFDDFGVKEVRCMNCGVIVGKRTYVEVENKNKPGVKVNVLTFKMWSNSRRVRFPLSDNRRTIKAFLCIDCEKIKPDIDLIENQVLKGLELEMKHRGEKNISAKMKEKKKFFKLKREVSKNG